jgi:outer membrane protein
MAAELLTCSMEGLKAPDEKMKEKRNIVMKGRIIASIAITLLLAKATIGQPQANQKLTLKQCVDAALNNNLQVRQTDIQAQTAGVNVKQAKGNLLPDLFGNFNHGMNEGRSIDPFTNSYVNQQINFANYSLSSSVVLFNGLQLRNLVKQSSLVYEANKMDVQQIKDNVMLNVILAYVQVLNNQELVQQARNQAEVTRRQVERLRILNESGAVPPAQFYDLKGQLANDELGIVNSRNALNNAQLSLAQLMNVAYMENLELAPITADTLALQYGKDPVSLYDIAYKQLAIIKAAELRRQSAVKGIKAAKGVYYPTVSLAASFNTNYSSAAMRTLPGSTVIGPSGDYVDVGGSKVPVMTTRTDFTTQKISYSDQFNNNYNTSVYVSIQVPILNGFRAKNRVTQAKIDLRNAEIVSETVKTQLSQNIEQAYFNMNAALDRYKTLQQQVADFAESFRTAEVRFNAGAITQVDYIIAKNNLERAQINLITNKYDYIFRTKILDYYQNTLSLD